MAFYAAGLAAASEQAGATQSVASLEREAMARAKAGEYEKAEALLSRALARDPGNFKLLYNLGVAASFAGHPERAREVLQAALRQQPRNVDVLYGLAYVHSSLKQPDISVRLLAQAAQLAPRRADIQKLLALATFDLGALADSLEAWDRYLALQPADDLARRERAFTAVRLGQFEQGIAGLEWFLARHPGDATGHYELGIAQSQVDPAKALAHLDKAIALDADFVEARAARGSLYYRRGKPEAAVGDLERAASLRPGDALTLDRLGQTYLALERPDDAVRVLRRAAELAPDDPTIQLHFGRALADAGNTGESRVVMDRFRQLGPSRKRGVPAGLVEYLSLTPEQQRADYNARVEKAVAKNPDDTAALMLHLQLLLDDGNYERAAVAARRIASLKPGDLVLARAGRALLFAGQYPLAKELLEQAVAIRSSPESELDLAIAEFRAAGASAGLARMERIPEPARSGDYYLARAQMLAASGRADEAVTVLPQALREAPKRADLFKQAAAFLNQAGRTADALRLLDQAAGAMPEDREFPLLSAATMELSGDTASAERALNRIQNRWPEWHAGWVARGIVLAVHGRCEEAIQALQTAVALGARSVEAYYALAECAFRASRFDAAGSAAKQALKLAPGDPWVQTLAGRIALRRGDKETAVARLREAIRLRPGLARAHEALAQAYAALGRKQEAAAESAKAAELQRAGKNGERPAASSLFYLKPPREW